MKVLVTGGSGFIGRHTIAELKKESYTPLSFDRHAPTDCLGDVRDSTSVFESASRVDGIIHLAAILGTQEGVKNPGPSVETNILGTINVLEAAARYQIPVCVIGVGNHWMNNAYSITKSASDRFCRMYKNDRGVMVNVVRTVNAYGPGQEPAAPYGSAKVRKVLPSFICRALNNDPIEIYGEGEQFSDMIYVGDVAKALVKGLEKASQGEAFDSVIEVGPVYHTRVVDLAKRVKVMTDSGSEIVHLPMRPGEQPQDVVADTLTMDLIGMSPEDLKPLSEGLEETIDYYRA